MPSREPLRDRPFNAWEIGTPAPAWYAVTGSRLTDCSSQQVAQTDCVLQVIGCKQALPAQYLLQHCRQSQSVPQSPS